MPENPEVEARVKQVKKLRGIADSMLAGTGLGEEMSPRGLAVHIQQAANEIEDLAKITQEEEDAFLWRVQSDIREFMHELFRREAMGYEPHLDFVPSQRQGNTFSVLAVARPLKMRLEVEFNRGGA